ncbi:hypothetical protein CEXT_233241 [Caerostris extrusa]|uniref:Uncharacterized protein n=1 Tax=Caerostris extrusa TaxID=172846 RepID=A0AAV4XVN2_CAEEX|nr:hypothetical protein CEXT_233241 [Caerostris extrusa]
MDLRVEQPTITTANFPSSASKCSNRYKSMTPINSSFQTETTSNFHRSQDQVLHPFSPSTEREDSSISWWIIYVSTPPHHNFLTLSLPLPYKFI